ncbi:chromate transporter [Ruminococcaceae bacterium OttesenSCG-928-A11]|nr:chromate transporter [Ruminococcaceae bacterium OttesenSCG-928-A11]
MPENEPQTTGQPSAGDERSRAKKVRQIFLAYLTSMLFAFTGGNMTLPLLQQQLDDKYKLLSRDKVLELFALGQALPGVISLNGGILIGRTIAGWPGAFAAVAGCVVPAFAGMMIITFGYVLLSGLSVVAGFIGGIRAASVAIILQTSVTILGKTKGMFYALLAAAAFLCVFFLGWNIAIVVIACGFAGVVREFAQSGRAAP